MGKSAAAKSNPKRVVKVFTKQEVVRANGRLRSPHRKDPSPVARRSRSRSLSMEKTTRLPRSAGLTKLLNSVKLKRERARRRQKKYGQRLRASLGERTILESHSVREETHKNYVQKLEKFYEFVLFYQLSIRTQAELDAALCDYADHLYLCGENCSSGARLQAALEHHRPEAIREGQLHLPRFKRAMKGWRRLAPTQSRLPMIEFVKSAISAVLLETGRKEMALFNELSFSTYARPGELLKLKAVDYVEKNSDFGHSVVVLAPVERGETTKAGIYDEILILDDQRAPWMDQLVKKHSADRIRLHGEDADMWGFKAADYLLAWRSAVEALEVGDIAKSPYQNRHGGASRDHLLKLRSTQSIQRRGRWASDSSARIYDKPGRLQQSINKHGDRLRKFGEDVRLNFLRLYQSGMCQLPTAVKRKMAARSKASTS